MKESQLLPNLKNSVEQIISGFSLIPESRKPVLEKLTEYIKTRVQSGKPVNLNFICTHNARRSHLSQIWAQAAAHYYNIPDVNTYSGGSEVTYCNPRAVKALQSAGFNVKNGSGENPVYEISYADGKSVKAWSKKFDDPSSPNSDFAAVMVCSDADQNCPFIPGATRIKVNFEDPKIYDNTPDEEKGYAERSRQIAREIFYAFSKVNF